MQKKKAQLGFSLVELMVASALFMTVVAVAAGSFISVLDASRDSREFAELMTNIDFALEDMSRNIRVGENFTIMSDGKEITFNIVRDGAQCNMSFRLAGERIQKSRGGSSSSCNSHVYTDVTSSEIVITDLTFSGDQMNTVNDQPRIIINVAGRTDGGTVQTFNLQTSVTQRALNF